MKWKGEMIKQSKIDKLFNLACQSTPVSNARVVAAIFDGKELIAIGNNQSKTHSFQSRFQKNEKALWIHAEINAIYKATKKIGLDRLKRCTMFVIRAKKNMISKDWEYGLARPCSGCQAAISVFNIKNVYYSTDNGEILKL